MARKKKHPEHVNHERWLVSYADFITLLFAFFTTLYAISTVDQKKAGKLQYAMMTAFQLDFFPNKVAVGSEAPSSIVPSMFETPGAAVPAPSESKAERAARRKAAMSALNTKLDQLVKDTDLGTKVKIRHERGATVVSLDETGFFSSGSADIQRE